MKKKLLNEFILLSIIALGSTTVVICYILNIPEIYESLTQIEGMWSILIFILIRISFTLGMSLIAFRQWFNQENLHPLDMQFLFGVFFLTLTFGKSLDLLYKITYFTAEKENLLTLLKIRYILIILTAAPLILIGLDIILLMISDRYEQLTNNAYRNRINLIIIALITAFESLIIIFAPDLISISVILVCIHMPSLAWIICTFYYAHKVEQLSELKPKIIAIAFFIDFILYTISIIINPYRNKNIGFSPTYIIFAEVIDLIIIMIIFVGFYKERHQVIMVNKIRPELSIKVLNKVLDYRYQNQLELKKIKKKLLARQINYSEMYDLTSIAQDNDELDELEKIRWIRQIKNTILNQKRIKNARVVVFGCGGVGSNVLVGLSYAGVYNFKIVDFDKVELSNLNQQTLYYPKDIGKFKVDIAQERLVQINPEIRVDAINLKLNYPKELNLLEMDESKYPDDIKKIDKLIKWGDYIVSASDYFGSPYLINDLCIKNQKPYYWGGCNYFLSDIFSYYPKEKTACIRCLFGPTDFTDKTQHFRYNKPNSVYKAINFGTTNILTGTFIAENIIKDICKIENNIHGCYTIYDGYDKELYKIPINTNDNCKCLLYR